VTTPARKIANSAEMDVRKDLVGRIVAHAPTAGEHSTAISGLILFRQRKPRHVIALRSSPASRFSYKEKSA